MFLRDVAGIDYRTIGRYVLMWSPYRFLHLPAQPNPTNAPRLTRREKFLVAGWFAALVGALVFIPDALFYYLLLWVLPQLTVLTALFRLRTLAEHHCVPGRDELAVTLTCSPPSLDTTQTSASYL